MDYYQHDVFSHLEDSRRISQYNLSSLGAGDRLSVSIKLLIVVWSFFYSHIFVMLLMLLPQCSL